MILIPESGRSVAKSQGHLGNAGLINGLLSPSCLIRVSEAHSGDPQEHVIARLHPAKGSYEIEATETRPIWVNGVRVTEHLLQSGDMIEFCGTGPMSRFCLYPEDKPLRKTVADILGDAIAYLRVSRQPYFQRMFKAIGGSLRRLVRETTIWTLLTKVETSCDRILIAGGANVEAEWEQGPAV